MEKYQTFLFLVIYKLRNRVFKRKPHTTTTTFNRLCHIDFVFSNIQQKIEIGCSKGCLIDLMIINFIEFYKIKKSKKPFKNNAS